MCQILCGQEGKIGNQNGKGTSAQFNYPSGIFFNQRDQFLYVCDNGNHSIRRISLDGEVTTLTRMNGVQGSKDGTLEEATFYNPTGITGSNDGKLLYICDSWNHTIREINLSTKSVRTICGIVGKEESKDGLISSNPTFNYPIGIVLNSHGNLIITEYYGCKIREVKLRRNETSNFHISFKFQLVFIEIHNNFCSFHV